MPIRNRSILTSIHSKLPGLSYMIHTKYSFCRYNLSHVRIYMDVGEIKSTKSPSLFQKRKEHNTPLVGSRLLRKNYGEGKPSVIAMLSEWAYLVPLSVGACVAFRISNKVYKSHLWLPGLLLIYSHHEIRFCFLVSFPSVSHRGQSHHRW
jgi:hypothetical protein